MTPIALNDIRQRFADALSAGMTEWTESPWVYEREVQDPLPSAHQTFVVGIGDTVLLSPRRRTVALQQSGVTTHVLADTAINIRLVTRVTESDVAEAANAPLRAEMYALHALALHFNGQGAGAYTPKRVTRRAVADATFMVTTIELSIKHMFLIT